MARQQEALASRPPKWITGAAQHYHRPGISSPVIRENIDNTEMIPSRCCFGNNTRIRPGKPMKYLKYIINKDDDPVLSESSCTSVPCPICAGQPVGPDPAGNISQPGPKA